MNQAKEFYLETGSGDSLLAEIFEESGVVTLLIGDARYDLTVDSAFDLADAILMIANDTGVEDE